MHVELNDITHISRKYLNTIKKISDPLKEKFGITYFARQSVSNDGYWEILGNLPDWLDHSASKEFYQIDSSLIHPAHYKSGFIVNSSYSVPEHLKNLITETRDVYDIDHTLCIFEKTSKGGEWYFFGTSAKNHHIVNTYISQINAIYKYIPYFREEAKKILDQNLDFKINLSHLKNEDFQSPLFKINLFAMKNGIDEILESFGKRISSREKDCLHLLVNGKTVKETAKILRLSPRTIEGYLNRLKEKVGCKHKRELLALLTEGVHSLINQYN